MPLVSIRYRDAGVTIDNLKQITQPICDTVAKQLSFHHDGQDIAVTPDKVKIRFDTASIHDVNMSDVHIEVEAYAYEVRKQHLDSYASELGDAIGSLLPNGTDLSIWYKLCEAAWDVRQITDEVPAGDRENAPPKV